MGRRVKESNCISTDRVESVPLIIIGIIKDNPATNRKSSRYDCDLEGFCIFPPLMEICNSSLVINKIRKK